MRSAKDVSGGGEENARAVVIPGIELPVLDHQLAVKQIELFDSGVAMRRIVGARREPHQQADAVVLGIRREQLVGEARRRFTPSLQSSQIGTPVTVKRSVKSGFAPASVRSARSMPV